MNKTVYNITMVITALSIGVLVGWVVGTSTTTDVINSSKTEDFDKEQTSNDSTSYQDVLLPTYSSKSLSISVPQNYNVYYNGDPEIVTDPTQIYSPNTVSMAISSSDRPVSLSDMNWQQIDFRLTLDDIVTADFIASERIKDDRTVNEVSINGLSGYKISDIFESNVPSKADTGGDTYYLTANVEGRSWNLIVTKQSIGDGDFELKSQKIIDSINFLE